MVRRSAPVLAAGLAVALATAYFLLIDDLPSVSGDGGRMLAAFFGAVAVGVCALAPLPWRHDVAGLVVLGIGAALLATALTGQDVGAAANPVEAIFAAAVGLLFARAFALPLAVVALPVLVAGIDAASVFASSDHEVADFDPVDVLTFDLPAWGGGASITSLGFLDAAFLALFAAWAIRYGLRPRVAIPLMVAGLALSTVLAVAVDRPIPALPFLAVAFLAPGARRLPRLLRSA